MLKRMTNKQRKLKTPAVAVMCAAWFLFGIFQALSVPCTNVLTAFTRLEAVPAPKITATGNEFPWEALKADKLVDGDPQTEFAAHGDGTNTFVEFDFGTPVRLGGIRHQDRKDPAIIAASEFVFTDADGKQTGPVKVKHAKKPGGVTWFAFAEAVTARKARWRVTELGSQHGTVGGAELVFYRALDPEAAPRQVTIKALVVPVVRNDDRQTLRVSIQNPYAENFDAILHVEGQQGRKLAATFGDQFMDYEIPAVRKAAPLKLGLELSGSQVVETSSKIVPTRQTTIYILPHSHTDIGYTEIQTEIEDKQVNNLLLGIQRARETASNPPGARFIWNVEVLWAADLYLKRLGAAERAMFFDAVKKGHVALCGMYLNELTGLCRPEELVRLFQFAAELRQQTGATIDAAMISDVPGYTWGTVPAMLQGGLKYFSVAPNYFDRIGDILTEWENKPFWWVGPDGKSKVLVWIPYRGYAMSHLYRQLSADFVVQYQSRLDDTAYPYDIAYMRWSGHGDNAAPDPAICDFVKEWSAKNKWPKFVISSASDAFQALEKRYGDKLPQVRGDWTPYWEDGAGSSSLETGMNRASSDRLVQAEALWVMQKLSGYPAAGFREAWNNVLLYSEHTWGAWCSLTDPARRETREQWAIKQSYAMAGDRQSRDLLSLALGRNQNNANEGEIDVFNTASWPRSELVLIPKYLSGGREIVVDDAGKAIPTQRLSSGELAFIAEEVPALAARRYLVAADTSRKPAGEDPAKAVRVAENTLDNDRIRVRVDAETGGIVELRLAGIDANLADTANGQALNEYLYFIGDNANDAQKSGKVTVRVGERGPLAGSLIIESEAPGCHGLTRELKLVAGSDHVEIVNVVDKRRIVAKNYLSKEGKESLNFGFPFNVPDGQARLDVPFGVVRPDADQIPSACKNWLTVGRWADVANADYGVTWVTLDAPLLQIGGLTANLLNSQANPNVWRKKIGASQKLYSWAMNNHWGTNYRAYQEGPVVFRFVLRPHRGPTDPAAATRFSTAFSQPLLVAGARGRKPLSSPLFRVCPADVVITGMKPSEDGKAIIVRLYNAALEERSAALDWTGAKPRAVRLSDTSEKRGKQISSPLQMPPFGLLTLRIEER